MADIKKLGGTFHGKRNRDGWPPQRQEARERWLAPIKFIGGMVLLLAAFYSFITTGFLLPG